MMEIEFQFFLSRNDRDTNAKKLNLGFYAGLFIKL